MPKSKLPKMNVRLLRRIQKHLAEEPLRYIQNKWLDTPEGEEAPACNTVGCIAGWAVVLSEPKPRWAYWKEHWRRVPEKARKLLGITQPEADVLYSPFNQYHNYGLDGVNSAKAKIDSLIEDRGEFAKGNQTW